MAPEPQQMSSSVMFLWSPAISVTVLTSTSAPVVLSQHPVGSAGSDQTARGLSLSALASVPAGLPMSHLAPGRG